MTWQLAPALKQLLWETNKVAKKRSKKSDGTIGDADHSSRASDHNPNAEGFVCALDLTHDPRNGFNSYKFAEALRQRCENGTEKRVNYIISKGRICSTRDNWAWREYTGLNAHKTHVHISVKQDSKRYKNVGTWWVKNWYQSGRATND